MTDIFGWTLRHPHRTDIAVVRVVLVDRIAVAITYSPAFTRQKVTSWSEDTAAEARDSALFQTEVWERNGFVLDGTVCHAWMDVHLPSLTMECQMIEGVGPTLWGILASLPPELMGR